MIRPLGIFADARSNPRVQVMAEGAPAIVLYEGYNDRWPDATEDRITDRRVKFVHRRR